ncbi:hypothetical protein [Psychrobacillus sp. BM2]|uniref:hypothetical protein n=1 Tax=Psychrobacillus sp. BM2 TaxID=3400421 RepID=UPI003B015D83
MDFDTMIDEKKLQKQQVVKQMEEKKLEILDELVTFVKDWYDKQILKTIKEHSDIVMDLGDEKARELKDTTITLIDNTHDIVMEYVNKPNLWWHEQENNNSYYISSNKILPELEAPIKHIFGELGSILLKYGLDGDPARHSNTWVKDYSNGNGKVKYAYGVTYSPKLCKLSNEYVDFLDLCKKINGEIASVEDKKKRENVEEWWKTL